MILLVICSFLSGLFIETTNSQRRIVGGEEVQSDKQFMVYLVKAPKSKREYDAWICGGAIVSPFFIVTSAACVEDVQYMYAIAGYNKYVKPNEIKGDKCVSSTKKKIVYTCVPRVYSLDYDKIEKWALVDIAVARVDTPYRFGEDAKDKYKHCSYTPKKIKISYEDKHRKAGVSVITYGWGHTKKYRKPEDTRDYNQRKLRLAHTKIMENRKCANIYRETNPEMVKIINQYMICTNGKSTTKTNDESGELVGLEGCDDYLDDDNTRKGYMRQGCKSPFSVSKWPVWPQYIEYQRSVTDWTTFLLFYDASRSLRKRGGTLRFDDNTVVIVNKTEIYNKKKGITPKKPIDVTPKTNDEPSPERHNDATPETNYDVTPEENDDPSLVTNYDATPETNYDVTPETNDDPSPETNYDATPETNYDDPSPETNYDATPETNYDITPETNDDPSPKTNDDPSSNIDKLMTASGICQNDHGGPLTTREDGIEMLVGVSSVFRINDDYECIGPFLFTSTHCSSKFLRCIIESEKYRRNQDPYCYESDDERGFSFQEKTISWDGHPDGPAENQQDSYNIF